MMTHTIPKFTAFALKGLDFSKRSLTTAVILLVFLSISFIPHVHAKKEKENNIKVKVLQNKEHNECMFIGEVVVRVKYRLRTADYAILVAELSEDGIRYYEATSLDIERGKGNVIMTFDAGACATDMRVVVR